MNYISKKKFFHYQKDIRDFISEELIDIWKIAH